MEHRTHNIRLLLGFGVLLTWPTIAAAAPCYDLGKGQPAGLSGILDYVVFAGPPHYESVQKGDTPNPSFVLRLAHPICIQGSRAIEPKTLFRTVQLAKTAEVEGKLKPLLHRPVTVTLKNPAPDTAHSQAPLFAWVTGIAPTRQPMEPVKERVSVPPPHQVDVAKAHGIAATTHRMKLAKEDAAITHQTEFKNRLPISTSDQMEVANAHGTAARTVRAFYAGLAKGRGDIASAMVVPRKRADGPFSADELSRFFGHLKKRITLGEVETNGPGEFLVHYRYAASARDCHGRAVVKTVVLGGKAYIESINALDRC